MSYRNPPTPPPPLIMLGYTYKDLSIPEKYVRRQSLDAVGRNTILSQLAIIVLAYIYGRRRPVQSIFLRKLEWWLMRPVSWNSPENKSPADWIVGSGWIGWMVWLAVRGASDDYLHLTKAFGMAAAANFPLHMLLSMKRTPLRYVFGASYEGKINHMHQGLGKIINLLLSAHACLYLKFFWDTSRVKTRLLEFDVFCGVLGFVFLDIIVIASRSRVRRHYYWIFYIFHVTLSPFLFPLFYFHVSYLRPYLLVSLAFFGYDRILRALTCMRTTATVRHLSPDILHLSIQTSKTAFPPTPISHLLLTVPRVSSWTKNPFTVADFSQEDGRVQIVARIRNGFTKRLALLAVGGNEEQTQVAVVLDMHYGACMSYMGLASQFNRILIVTGGVGGVFAVPWLKYIANTPGALERTRFIWSMRDTGTLLWAAHSSTAAGIVKGKVEAYITSANGNQEETEEGMEMQEMQHLGEPYYSERREEIETELKNWGVEKEKINFGRPDLEDALKEVVKSGSVAVLVCGPWELGAGVRKAAGERIKAGGKVWVHVEEFGS